MGAYEDVIPDLGMCRNEGHALDADIVPEGTVPLDDGGRAYRDPIPDSGLLPDEDIMAGGEVVADVNITIKDGPGSQYGIGSQDRTGKVLLIQIFP